MKTWLLTLALLLTGCGYTPLYGNNVNRSLSNVYIAKVQVVDFEREAGARRIAQYLRQELSQRFTGTASARYHLTLRVEEELSDVAVRRDATVQRQSLRLDVEAQLKDGEAVLMNRRFNAASAYNADLTPLSTEAGRDQARRSAAVDIEAELLNAVGLALHKHGRTQ